MAPVCCEPSTQGEPFLCPQLTSAQALRKLAVILLFSFGQATQSTFTDADIHAAVNDYVNGNSNGYPPVGQWDVSQVTNMTVCASAAKSVPVTFE